MAAYKLWKSKKYNVIVAFVNDFEHSNWEKYSPFVENTDPIFDTNITLTEIIFGGSGRTRLLINKMFNQNKNGQNTKSSKNFNKNEYNISGASSINYDL